MNLEKGDTLLLCSDGLHSLVTDEEIARTLAEQPPSSATKTLVDRANALGGNDNITVVVARVDSLGKEVAPSRGRTEMSRAKTVTVPGRRRGPGGRRGPLLLRIVLLPFKLLIWALKLLGQIAWATLRLLFRRRR